MRRAILSVGRVCGSYGGVSVQNDTYCVKFSFPSVRQYVFLRNFCPFSFPRPHPSIIFIRHPSVIHRCDVAFFYRIGFLVLAFFHKLPGWSIRSATATASAASFGREKPIVGWTSGTPNCTTATVASHWSAATSAATAATTRSARTLRQQSLERSYSFAAPSPPAPQDLVAHQAQLLYQHAARGQQQSSEQGGGTRQPGSSDGRDPNIGIVGISAAMDPSKTSSVPSPASASGASRTTSTSRT